MKKITLERHVTIFNITTPYLFTEKRYIRYLNELKNTHRDARLGLISDVTVAGEFLYGKAGSRAAKNIRIEVFSTHITDDEVKEIMTKIFETVK